MPLDMAQRAPLFEIRRSPIHGRGAFALRTIRRGTRLIEYLGERISQKEATRRYPGGVGPKGITLLFHIDSRTCIDAGIDGNEARFINHSCAPNCEAALSEGRVFIYSTATIRAGSELTYDYNLIVDSTMNQEEAMREYPCRCGLPGCRGTIAHVKKRRRPRAAAAQA